MILVTGARGVVGVPLVQRLEQDGADFMSISRSSSELSLQWDLSEAANAEQLSQAAHASTLIHTAPIWLLPQHVSVLANGSLKRIVAFSSTSVLSKQSSPNSAEQVLVRSLADAEESLAEQCATQGIALTILRPSLIYGYGRDENISKIAHFIRKWKVMFLVGKASGKRQPVHADDLVQACLACLQEPKTAGQAYNLAGRDTMSYTEMVERIFVGLGVRPRIIRLPLSAFRWALVLAAKLTGFAYTAEMANRMNQNLAYDTVAAKNDFGFQPQGFLQHPERDLPI
ncbi:MAG: nucleoside-diphosphate-sugar epimerase [Cryomorphaceae bacterium]